jgi:hypothetical protein
MGMREIPSPDFSAASAIPDEVWNSPLVPAVTIDRIRYSHRSIQPTTAMNNKNFVSWLAQMLLGFAAFVGGLECARIFWSGSLEWAIGAVVAALGLTLMVVAELRERPQRVLRRARRSISFPTQWAVRFDKSVPHGGVIPVAVIRSDGVRFVIDIQGFPEADWNDPLIGEPLLVGPRGKKFKSDPVGPLMQAAEAWGATAILWLPEAKTPRNLRQSGCNLIVVMGGARELKHVLRGAEIAPRHDATLEMTLPPKRGSGAKSRKPAAVAAPEMA